MFDFFLAFEFLEAVSKAGVRRVRRVPRQEPVSAYIANADVRHPSPPPKSPTPPPGPSGMKRAADDDEITPIKKPAKKRRKSSKRPTRNAAILANELIKTHLEEIRLGKRLWMRRSPKKRTGDDDSIAIHDVADNADVSDEEDGVYAVESILDEKVLLDGTKWYKIKWVDDATPTWEPAEHLVDCNESLELFEAHYDAGFDDRSVIDSESEPDV